MTKRAAQIAVGVAVSAVGVWLATRGVEWRQFSAALGQVRPAWLLAAAVSGAAAVLVGGLRWRAAARPHAELSAADAIDIVMICNLANVMVSRLGDLVRAGLTARRSRAGAGRVLGGVILERFVDVLMLLVLAFGLAQFVGFPPAVRTGVYLFAVVALAALVTLWWAAPWVAALVRRTGAVVPRAAAESIAGMIDTFSSGLRGSAGNGQLTTIVVLSVVIWVLSGLTIVLTIGALRLPVPWAAAFFVLMVINLGGAIPASPGAIGVYHYLFVLALSVWAPNPSAAFGVAVVSHALGLIVTAILGAIGLLRQGVNLWRLSPPAISVPLAAGQ